jgi:hypothetical protein
MAHVCKRCGYSATTKASLIRHLQSKSQCPTKDSDTAREVLIEQLQMREYKTDTTYCPTCNKLIAKTNLARHRKVCKENTQSNMVQVSAEIIHNLQTQIDKLSKDQATSTEVSQHLQTQIDEIRRELQTHEHSELPNQQLQYAKEDVVLVENESLPTTIRTTKKSKISQAIRIVCWNTYIGEEIGKAQCVCCKTNFITQHNFHCGHVIAEANGGKVQVNNLRPICAVCNNSMGTINMMEFALNNFDVEI